MKSDTKLITSLAATVILCCASLLSAARKPGPTSFEALVVKVDGLSVALDAVEEKHFKRTTVQTDSSTQVILNGTTGAPTWNRRGRNGRDDGSARRKINDGGA